MRRWKWVVMVMLCLSLVLAGCGKKNSGSVVKDLNGVMERLHSYHGTGQMILKTGQDPQEYQVEVCYEAPAFYRIALTNAKKDITQIVLRNNDGVFVLTPHLNKSFRFQSDWPENQGQVYLYQSLVQSILMDNERQFTSDDKGYVFDVVANYQNGSLARQKVWLDKKTYAPQQVEVADANANVLVVVKFDHFEFDAKFEKDYFDMQRNMTSWNLKNMPTMAGADKAAGTGAAAQGNAQGTTAAGQTGADKAGAQGAGSGTGQSAAGQGASGQSAANQGTGVQATGQGAAGQGTGAHNAAGQGGSGQGATGQSANGQSASSGQAVGQSAAGQGVGGQATGQSAAGQGTSGQAAGQSAAGQGTSGQAAGQGAAGTQGTAQGGSGAAATDAKAPHTGAATGSGAGTTTSPGAATGAKPMSFGVIEPGYMPAGVKKQDTSELQLGEDKAVMLRYSGTYNYTLVESRPVTQTVSILPGDIVDLGFTLAVVTGESKKTLTWTYEGVEFRLSTGDLPMTEMIKVAQAVQGEMGK